MAWSQAHAKLHTLLRSQILLPKDSHVLMAVSGGQDSLCMARLLIDLQPHWNWTLGLIHCDHRWRDDSEANADHVLGLAADWKIPAWCVAADFDIDSEAAARAWRYETFATVAREHGYRYLVCGHTMSDRAETVLYNLIRGSGLDGIATLPWQRPIDDQSPTVSLTRPLLTFSRQDTADVCHQQNLPVWEDTTNQSLAFRRNRIRQELLPYLREHFNPQVERSLAQTLEMTAADVAYLNEQSASIYRRVISYECDRPAIDSETSVRQTGIWKIDQKALSCESLSMQRRVVKQLLQEILVRSPSFQHVDKVVGLLRASQGTQCDPLPGGYLARVCKPFVLISSGEEMQ